MAHDMTAPKTGIIFRSARRGDVPAVVALLTDDSLGRTREGDDPETYLTAFDAMQAEAGNQLFVAEDEAGIVACYQLTFISGLSRRAARRAQIESVRVRPDRRGEKLGEQLMQDAETRARAAGCTLFQFTTDASRKDAHRFYDRLGFTPSHIGYKKAL